MPYMFAADGPAKRDGADRWDGPGRRDAYASFAR